MKRKFPIVQKTITTNDFYIERSLPEKGTINVKKGDTVEPFTNVGQCNVSYFRQRISPEFAFSKSQDSFIEKDIEIGWNRKNSFRVRRLFAPYNGFIRREEDGSFYFEQEKTNYSLLSGVWGEVLDVVEELSVLVKSQATILYAAVSTPFEAEGELIVFPNPSDLLEDPYFNNFTKEISGKLIYSGHFVKLNNLKKSISLGVRGIICGGCDKVSFDYAYRNNFMLACLSGFGRIPTPPNIYETFNSVSNRYLFVRGERGEIIIPSEHKFTKTVKSEKTGLFVEPKSGMIVQVLERPYFGWMGTIESEEKGRFRIRLHLGGKIVFVNSSNILILSV